MSVEQVVCSRRHELLASHCWAVWELALPHCGAATSQSNTFTWDHRWSHGDVASPALAVWHWWMGYHPCSHEGVGLRACVCARQAACCSEFLAVQASLQYCTLHLLAHIYILVCTTRLRTQNLDLHCLALHHNLQRVDGLACLAPAVIHDAICMICIMPNTWTVVPCALKLCYMAQPARHCKTGWLKCQYQLHDKVPIAQWKQATKPKKPNFVSSLTMDLHEVLSHWCSRPLLFLLCSEEW